MNICIIQSKTYIVYNRAVARVLNRGGRETEKRGAIGKSQIQDTDKCFCNVKLRYLFKGY